MSTTPIDVPFRPFAIEPVTRMMLPDGVFDNALHHLRIAAHFTNTSGSDLTDVTIYLESVGDPGIVPVARTHTFATVLAGATVMVAWDADFEHATPGKRLVSFVARAAGFDPHRVIQQIFVSQTRYDPVAEQYTCEIEEGTLVVSSFRAIGPRQEWGPDGKCRTPDGPYVPTGFTSEWHPNPAYEGAHGDLPFSDPWWKVLAVIVAIIAAIVAAVAAATGGGTASVGVAGTFDETDPSVSCCTPDPHGSSVSATVAGVASGIATGALIVACSDDADPWWRGQEATAPDPGVLTTGEKVVASWTLPAAPNAGVAYTADVEWTYTRTTTAGTATHSITETQTNIHVAGPVTVEAPPTIGVSDDLWVRATVDKPDGSRFTGPDLYTFAALRAPGGMYFVIDLTDDGLGFDPKPDDGVYAGALSLERAHKILLRAGQDPRGRWDVFFFAQDVDQTRPGTKPEIAAQEIGGMFVASALTLTFDPTLPCPLQAHATVQVV
ncbi:MAG: hypothetical protein IR158_16125 [Cellulomonas sp.]|uniref:hypothetical protein n=1 Tax=Cellulomonas sp. TaxID=40001 RepID=UPI0019E814E4|nr:hypothetical protein [Cellulomonas sp.]MBF0689279.1 hypothetical protein [Cellulomonas sp.]